MTRVQMSRGCAYVSEEDADLALLRWRPIGKGYAARSVRNAGRVADVYMHRLIAERMGFDMSLQVDHIDGDPLNNVRENLRPATPAQNQHNRRHKRTGSSRFKGVSWAKSVRKWQVTIVIEKRQRHLGFFTDETEAAAVYASAASVAFGEFAAPRVTKK